MSVLNDPALERMLARLHARSSGQLDEMRSYFTNQGDERQADNDGRRRKFLSDKMVSLDRDKAEFCYQLCRATNARSIVEVGTSFGVSTLYLAAAIRDNVRSDHSSGRVIGTEYEPLKAAAARKNVAEAGLSEFIELREGDLRETLRRIDVKIDFVLVDIWIEMARSAIELIFPHLRSGASVVCDNTGQFRSDYQDYFQFIHDPKHGFRTMTLPFEGGLELSVKAECTAGWK